MGCKITFAIAKRLLGAGFWRTYGSEYAGHARESSEDAELLRR